MWPPQHSDLARFWYLLGACLTSFKVGRRFFQIFKRNLATHAIGNVWHFVCLCNSCELLAQSRCEKSCLIGDCFTKGGRGFGYEG